MVTAAVPDPRFRDQFAEGHRHDWIAWARPGVIRDSLGCVIDSSRVDGPRPAVVIQRLSGTDRPLTSGWWRTCRTCPAEEWSSAAEVEARVQAELADLADNIPPSNSEHEAKAMLRTRAAALASPAPAPRAEEGQSS